MKVRTGSALSAVCMGAVMLVGCGGAGGGSGAKAKLQFENKAAGSGRLGSSGQNALDAPQAPAHFGMKLLAVYLTEDIDAEHQNNIGNTAMIYLNPLCADDIMHCDVSGGTAEDGQPISKQITDFFEFARPSAQVNADINAQARDITPGTYRYARIEFCKGNQGHEPNVTWSVDGVTHHLFERNQCTVNSVEMSPPLTVAAGESVAVTLSYDLSAAVKPEADTHAGDNCVADGSGYACLTLPTFVPHAG